MARLPSGATGSLQTNPAWERFEQPKEAAVEEAMEFKYDPKKSSTQEARIMRHLYEGKAITPLEALNLYGCMRLASVVCRLKQQGHNIEVEMVKSSAGKRFAKYFLATLNS